MANSQRYMNETLAQIAVAAATAAVQAVFAKKGDGNKLFTCRCEVTGVRPRLDRPLPSYTFADEVKNIFHTHKAAKAENILGRQALIQAEHKEGNETVKSLQFCKIKRPESENVEE